jgi:hypothetical protein
MLFLFLELSTQNFETSSTKYPLTFLFFYTGEGSESMTKSSSVMAEVIFKSLNAYGN